MSFMVVRDTREVVHSKCWSEYQLRVAKRDAQGGLVSVPQPETVYKQLPRVYRADRYAYCGELLCP